MEVFIGTIQPFAFNFAPRNWAFCAGQLLPISQYQALYALIGTTYGGDGTQTFKLPDLQGRLPIGQGALDERRGDRGTGFAGRGLCGRRRFRYGIRERRPEGRRSQSSRNDADRGADQRTTNTTAVRGGSVKRPLARS